jgi:hypothetical protein
MGRVVHLGCAVTFSSICGADIETTLPTKTALFIGTPFLLRVGRRSSSLSFEFDIDRAVIIRADNIVNIYTPDTQKKHI